MQIGDYVEDLSEKYRKMIPLTMICISYTSGKGEIVLIFQMCYINNS